MRLLIRKPLLLILAVLALNGCIISDAIHSEKNRGEIIPALRYVEYQDDRFRFEDISEGNPEVASKTDNIPVAQGAMKVDCERLREVGIVIRHRYISRSSTHVPHDFDYVVSWPDSDSREVKHFTYENRLRGWYLSGAARFLEPLSDGLLALSVTHRRKIIYTTDFDVVGCQ